MSFVGNNLNLPLFLQTRKRFKIKNPNYVENYMSKLPHLYEKQCKTHTAATVRISKIVHLHPRNSPNPTNKCQGSCEFGKRFEKSQKTSGLSPGQYDVPDKLFAKTKGDFGSYWCKIPTPKKNATKRQKRRKMSYIWNNSHLTKENLKKKCKKNAGIFSSDARARKPTTRCMINNPVSCYRDPNQPGPASYYPKNLNFEQNITPVTYTEPPISYEFLDGSNVPLSRAYMFQKKIQYTPGPNTFLNRYPKTYNIPRDKKFEPYIKWDYDRQRRNKFRLQSFKKINMKKFYSPEMRHVKGHGHVYLFKNIPPKREFYYANEIVAKKINERNTKMYAESPFLNIINNPKRAMISRRKQPLPKLPIKIKFYSLITASHHRKTSVKSKKSVGFLSGCERFKDSKRPQFLTLKQLAEIKSKLPIERQITDFPVTMKNIEDIDSRLHELPSKFCVTKVERKIRFKFHPIPDKEVISMRETFEEYFQKALAEEKALRTLNIKDFIIGDEANKEKIYNEIMKYSKFRKDMADDYNQLNLFTQRRNSIPRRETFGSIRNFL